MLAAVLKFLINRQVPVLAQICGKFVTNMSVPVRVENSVSSLKFLTVNDVINFEPLNKVENTEKTWQKEANIYIEGFQDEGKCRLFI